MATREFLTRAGIQSCALAPYLHCIRIALQAVWQKAVLVVGIEELMRVDGSKQLISLVFQVIASLDRRALARQYHTGTGAERKAGARASDWKQHGF